MSGRNPFATVFTNYPFPLSVLEPGKSAKDPVRVSLSQENPTNITYECISYDRSKESRSLKILLTDKEVEIPQPLGTALRNLRKADVARVLWADVLLGRDLQQQNEQASLARATLQNAKRTIAWLGPDTDRTAEAFDIIRRLATWWHQAAVRAGFPANFAQATTVEMNDIMSYFQSRDPAQLRPNDSELWEVTLAIFQSSYFESVQTISDLVLSDDIVITSGRSSISWPDFNAAFRALFVAMGQLLGRLPSKKLMDSFQRVGGIEIAYRRYRADPGLELLPMIQTARDMSTTDPREFVFSMLPITRPSKRTHAYRKKITIPMPIADYSKTVQEVFIETAKFIIEERQDFFLWWTERPPNGRRMENLPSWVPDWTTPPPDDLVKMIPIGLPPLQKWAESITDPKRISIIDNKIHLQAHELDRVKTVSSMFTLENCHRLLLQEWQKLPRIPNQTVAQKADQFWRTVILNIGGPTTSLREQSPPPHEMWISWQSVLAEERILELMGCTREQMLNDPSIHARIRASAPCQLLVPQCGKSEAYDNLLFKNAMGRRFFTTENGRMGMTSFEEAPPATGEGAESEDKIAASLNRMPTESDLSVFGMGDIMASFQSYVAQRDPRGGEVLGQLLAQQEKARGVKVGDVIVAAVGGFFPTVLRDKAQGASSSLYGIGGKEFYFVGDCYLHGVMDGEPMSQSDWRGNKSWKTDVKIEDIKIV
jgi:hypothetical protein